MPIHDWTRVDAGIFHAFHHDWITELGRALNRGLLPSDYYALAEQFIAGAVPTVLTLKGPADDNGTGDDNTSLDQPQSGARVQLAAPKLRPTAETDLSHYTQKQSILTVRHASGDPLVAVVEIVSRGNKAARYPLRAFIEKTTELIASNIHLLVLDLIPPGRRDPNGIHVVIWEQYSEVEYAMPQEKPLTFAAYEAGDIVRAYVVHATVGDAVPEMPLFLEPGLAITVPLEATYNAAFADIPRRWRQVLERPQA